MPIEELGSNNIPGTFSDPLENLKVRNENGYWINVKSFYYDGKGKTKKLTFDNGYTLECSYNHKIMTIDGWKKSSELKVGDKIVCIKKSDGDENYSNYLISVKFIEEGFADLYDIEVESIEHSYLINNIITHNTINFANKATVEDIYDIIIYAWKQGLKGLTVYR